MLYQIRDRVTNELLHQTEIYANAMKIAARYSADQVIILAIAGTQVLGKVA